MRVIIVGRFVGWLSSSSEVIEQADEGREWPGTTYVGANLWKPSREAWKIIGRLHLRFRETAMVSLEDG
jgi:hypothetical protein